MANNLAWARDSRLCLALCAHRDAHTCSRVGITGCRHRQFPGLLGGCERVVYVDRPTLVAPTVAPSLLHCMPEPAPLPAGARQRDVAPYVLDALAAGQDCRRKLGTVRAQLDTPAPAPAEPAAAAPPEATP